MDILGDDEAPDCRRDRREALILDLAEKLYKNEAFTHGFRHTQFVLILIALMLFRAQCDAVSQQRASRVCGTNKSFGGAVGVPHLGVVKNFWL